MQIYKFVLFNIRVARTKCGDDCVMGHAKYHRPYFIFINLYPIVFEWVRTEEKRYLLQVLTSTEDNKVQYRG